MTYASDRLYNEVIRRNLGNYATKLKVNEILPYLPCLTLTDKEEVAAKKDFSGNYAAVQMLLDNLRRRENWPEEFIAALWNCEHRELAHELSVAYDRIRGRTDNAAPVPAQVPASESTAAAAATSTVTTATIHTVPVTSPPHLTPPSVPVPEQTSAPSNIPAQVPPPASDVQHVPVPSAPPKPASQPQIPPPVDISSQAPLPSVVSMPKVTSPVQQNEVPTQSDTPDGQTSTSLSTGSDLSTLRAPASFSGISLSLTTNSQNSEKDQVPLVDTKSSENFPVQETNPPLNKEPEECSDPTVNKTVPRTNTVGMPIKATSIRTPQAAPSPPAVVVTHCLHSVSEELFSKPGTLSDEAVVEQEEPCSTTTSDLEISTTEPSSEPIQSVSLEQPSAPLSFISESSNASHLNQPEEDHYESSSESQLGILTNEIHISEEPSADNLNGQPPSMLGNKFNQFGGSGNLQHSMELSENQPGQNYESTESVVYPRKPSGRDATRQSDQQRSTTNNYQAQESNATKLTSNLKEEPREESQTTIQINKLHLTAAAAAVVSFGLFVVWKIKH